MIRRLFALSVIAFALFAGAVASTHFHSPTVGVITAFAVAGCLHPSARRQALGSVGTVFNDGNIPYGSQVVTINAISYVAEQIDFNESTKTIDRHDEIGNPNGAVYIQQKTTGSMTLQLATAAQAVPLVNTVVNLVFRGNPTAFVVTKVGQPQKQDDIRKITVEIAQKLN